MTRTVDGSGARPQVATPELAAHEPSAPPPAKTTAVVEPQLPPSAGSSALPDPLSAGPMPPVPRRTDVPVVEARPSPRAQELEARIQAASSELVARENQIPELAPGQGIVRMEGRQRRVEYRVGEVADGRVTLVSMDGVPVVKSIDELTTMLLDPDKHLEVHTEASTTSARVPAKVEGVYAQVVADEQALRLEGARATLGDRRFKVLSQLLGRRAELTREAAEATAELRDWREANGGWSSMSRALWAAGSLSWSAFKEHGRDPEWLAQAPQRESLVRLEHAVNAVDQAIALAREGKPIGGAVDYTADPRLRAIVDWEVSRSAAPSLGLELQARLELLEESARKGRVGDGWAAYHGVVQPYLANVVEGQGSVHRTTDGQASLTLAVNQAIQRGSLGERRLVLSSADLKALKPAVEKNWSEVSGQLERLQGTGSIKTHDYVPPFDSQAFDAEVARLERIEKDGRQQLLARAVDRGKLEASVRLLLQEEPGFLRRMGKGTLEVLDSPQTWMMLAVGAATGGAGSALLLGEAAVGAAEVTALVRAGTMTWRAAGLFGVSTAVDGAVFQTGMNVANLAIGEQKHVDFSPGAFAKSALMMGVSNSAQVAKALAAARASPGLMRAVGVPAGHFTAEAAGLTAVDAVERYLEEGKLDDAWSVLEQTAQSLVAMRALHGTRSAVWGKEGKAHLDGLETRLRDAERAYRQVPTKENLVGALEAQRSYAASLQAVNERNFAQPPANQNVAPPLVASGTDGRAQVALPAGAGRRAPHVPGPLRPAMATSQPSAHLAGAFAEPGSRPSVSMRPAAAPFADRRGAAPFTAAPRGSARLGVANDNIRGGVGAADSEARAEHRVAPTAGQETAAGAPAAGGRRGPPGTHAGATSRPSRGRPASPGPGISFTREPWVDQDGYVYSMNRDGKPELVFPFTPERFPADNLSPEAAKRAIERRLGSPLIDEPGHPWSVWPGASPDAAWPNGGLPKPAPTPIRADGELVLGFDTLNRTFVYRAEGEEGPIWSPLTRGVVDEHMPESDPQHRWFRDEVIPSFREQEPGAGGAELNRHVSRETAVVQADPDAPTPEHWESREAALGQQFKGPGFPDPIVPIPRGLRAPAPAPQDVGSPPHTPAEPTPQGATPPPRRAEPRRGLTPAQVSDTPLAKHFQRETNVPILRVIAAMAKEGRGHFTLQEVVDRANTSPANQFEVRAVNSYFASLRSSGMITRADPAVKHLEPLNRPWKTTPHFKLPSEFTPSARVLLKFLYGDLPTPFTRAQLVEGTGVKYPDAHALLTRLAKDLVDDGSLEHLPVGKGDVSGAVYTLFGRRVAPKAEDLRRRLQPMTDESIEAALAAFNGPFRLEDLGAKFPDVDARWFAPILARLERMGRVRRDGEGWTSSRPAG